MSLDDAYERLHVSGPERDGWLSNHAPMAVEALARHGHETELEGWISWYASKLHDMPDPVKVIDVARWEEALGDPRRIGDWMGFFADRMRERPWRDLLVKWWPRLLAAGSGEEAFDVAAAHRDEHVIKLTDTALDVYTWTGDPDALAAASTAAALIPRR